MNTHHLGAIFKVPKGVLVFRVKHRHTLKNYNKDFVSTVLTSLAFTVTEVKLTVFKLLHWIRSGLDVDLSMRRTKLYFGSTEIN